ncbi:MgtC/SapB family protein [Fluoribacter dumoffii]|uniref:MgtC/SapB family protein n=1 Tax=Fluoribacter dumoffii TaxID=463 RepID=UPI002244A319|nr:MgtC/SapB family protein [Fluoribacter dumoffii]MCW8384763.1 MgtC/SapB family protein [Fluoribacter dumoffii]MCW8496837.1 MgtC/SapB family protein [Fluoribacter dumoffii]
MLEILTSFIISLLIGFLIGIERERSHPEGAQFIGVRTFILLSVLGTLIATLNQTGLTITTSAFVFGILLLNYFQISTNQRKNSNIGALTEITGGIIFCIGFMVPSLPLIAITLSAIILLILIERKRLHRLAREKFKPHEMETVIVLVIFTLGILPLLPDRTIDPWHFFNPRAFGLLIATIAGIQLCGYVAIHLFGERMGIPLSGFMGGLVSSTAVFAQVHQTLKRYPQASPAILASGLLATVAMLVDVLLIIFVASPTLLVSIVGPLLAMISTGILLAVILLYYQKKINHDLTLLAKPLNLLSILQTSIFIGFLLLLVAMTKRIISINWILLISFLGGLLEIHGISLATALLYLGDKIELDQGCLMLYTAIMASFISKIVLLWTLTPLRFALQSTLLLMTMGVSGGMAYWFML